eukprot:10428440-Alexandrium_andersonii.AAC.1
MATPMLDAPARPREALCASAPVKSVSVESSDDGGCALLRAAVARVGRRSFRAGAASTPA